MESERFEFANPDDILRAIEELLQKPPQYNSERPQIEVWDSFRRRPAPEGDNGPGIRSTDSASGNRPPSKSPPIVGVRIQRSDAQRRKVQAWLMSQPSPPPARRLVRGARTRSQAPSATATTATAQQTPAQQSLRPTGSSLPPAIPVEIEPGLIIPVPHHSAHVSRRYRVRLDSRRWVIRFNHTGTVRTVRRMP